MKRIARVFVLVGAIVALSACRVQITDRIEVQPDGSAIVHLITKADDQLYQLAASQGQPMDAATPPTGWEIARRVDSDGNHVVDFSRHVASVSAIPDALVSAAGSTGQMVGKSTGLTTFDASKIKATLSESPGLFTKTEHIHIVIPAIADIMGANKTTKPNDPYAAAGAAMVASMLGFATELKLPGKVVSSNGEQMADGSYRFTHGFKSESTIDISTESPDIVHIGIALLIGFAIVGGAVLYRRRTGADKGHSKS